MLPIIGGKLTAWLTSQKCYKYLYYIIAIVPPLCPCAIYTKITPHHEGTFTHTEGRAGADFIDFRVYVGEK